MEIMGENGRWERERWINVDDVLLASPFISTDEHNGLV
jgi:hypothetical protein